jgi:hypothetical protein
MENYNDDEKNFINNIKKDKKGSFSFFDKNALNDVHNLLVNKTFRVNDNQSKKQMDNKLSNKANAVIQADKNVREAVQSLVISLSELGDKEIALKLIGEHIIMLNECFKEFE